MAHRKQACKLGRCDSYLGNYQWPTHRGRLDAIASKNNNLDDEKYATYMWMWLS